MKINQKKSCINLCTKMFLSSSLERSDREVFFKKEPRQDPNARHRMAHTNLQTKRFT